MSDWLGFQDTSRAVLSLSGKDARAVLQDVVTNDLAKLEDGPVYAALLTPQGKYLFDFILLAVGDDILIDAAADRAEALAARLKMYGLRRDLQIAPAPGMRVSLVWPGEGGSHPPPPPPSPGQTGTVIADPRDVGLGFRVYDEAPHPLAAGATRAEYDALRVRLAIPETGIELLPDETYILEAGFERLNGVDFRKGCYVGQEVTARMKHKTELRKGLARVQVDGSAAPGTPILTGDGKPAGILFTQAADKALAHLRFDRATADIHAGAARITYSPD